MHRGFTSERPIDGHAGYQTTTPSELIKQAALKLGFEKVGIVPATPLVEEGNRLRQWIESNYHGNMSWIARNPEMRSNPRILFPGARSVLVVALNYYTDAEHISSPETGKVSRYAWGDDYHDVLSSKLKALLCFIQEQFPEAEGKVCVDIQPMMDKAWAQRAGLGWIGKHTNLITMDYGSWVFLGELILNIDLDYDTEQVEDHCGTCTLCIDACPTQAITEPYVVDSNKCISYATIELRGPTIPDHVSEHLEGWLYGCDICQDVCPWNRFQQTTGESCFQPRDGNANADLNRLITLEHDEYVERFRGSAMKRAKLSGLQRNARTLLHHTT